MKKVVLGMAVQTAAIGLFTLIGTTNYSAGQHFFTAGLLTLFFFIFKAQEARNKNVVDCDADPFVPIGFTIEKHEKIGKIKIEPKSIYLYLADQQKHGGMNGFNLQEELSDFLIMNANVLDYLLVHQELIPEKCFGKSTVFWGTVYLRKDKSYVRCLAWEDYQWCWRFKRVAGEFGVDDFAAL